MTCVVIVQSLRQVLVELQRLAHQQPSCNTSHKSPQKPFTVVTFPSCSSHSSDNSTSPASQPDIQNTRSSVWAQMIPFWGPDPAPENSTDMEIDHQPASSSVLSRVQQLCNLRATATDAQASSNNSKTGSSSNSSSGSQLWSLDASVSEEIIKSLFYKRLYWRLGAHSAKESLIAQALQASSTGFSSSLVLFMFLLFLLLLVLLQVCSKAVEQHVELPINLLGQAAGFERNHTHAVCGTAGLAASLLKSY